MNNRNKITALVCALVTLNPMLNIHAEYKKYKGSYETTVNSAMAPIEISHDLNDLNASKVSQDFYQDPSTTVSYASFAVVFSVIYVGVSYAMLPFAFIDETFSRSFYTRNENKNPEPPKKRPEPKSCPNMQVTKITKNKNGNSYVDLVNTGDPQLKVTLA